MKTAQAIALAVLLLVPTACKRKPDAAAQAKKAAESKEFSFVNRVWRVNSAIGADQGSLYVFLSDGTLVITSPENRPALGMWSYKKGELAVVQDSLPYSAQILNLDQRQFRLRITGHGDPIELNMIQADQPVLTK